MKNRYCRCEWLGTFRNPGYVKIEILGVAVACLLLEGQQTLLCFNCRRGVFAAKLWLIWGERVLLFSWRRHWWAVEHLFFGSCHPLGCLLVLWIYGVSGLVDASTYSKTSVNLGTIPCWFFFLRSSSRMFPERFQIATGLVDFDEISRVGTENPESSSLSFWAPEITFLSSFPLSPITLEELTFHSLPKRLSCVTGFS